MAMTAAEKQKAYRAKRKAGNAPVTQDGNAQESVTALPPVTESVTKAELPSVTVTKKSVTALPSGMVRPAMNIAGIMNRLPDAEEKERKPAKKLCGYHDARGAQPGCPDCAKMNSGSEPVSFDPAGPYQCVCLTDAKIFNMSARATLGLQDGVYCDGDPIKAMLREVSAYVLALVDEVSRREVPATGSTCPYCGGVR